MFVTLRPQRPLARHKFSPRVNFHLASRPRLTTISGFNAGGLLNLLWLGRKMPIFRMRPLVPCGYRGMGLKKPPRRLKLG